MKTKTFLALGCLAAISGCGSSESSAVPGTAPNPNDTTRTELCGDTLDTANEGDVLSELELPSASVRRGGRAVVGVPVDALTREIQVELVTASQEILASVRMRKATGQAGTLSNQLAVRRTAPLGAHDLEVIIPLETGFLDSQNHVRYFRAATADLTYTREVVRNGGIERVNSTCLLVRQLEITQ